MGDGSRPTAGGHASALLLRALAGSQRAGNEFTFLVADVWPQRLYRKLGFEPAGLSYCFLRRLASASAA